MIQFTSRLKKEIDAKVEQIECSEISMITKSLDASCVLSEAFNQLKAFTLSYKFKSEDEEIFFFKKSTLTVLMASYFHYVLADEIEKLINIKAYGKAE